MRATLCLLLVAAGCSSSPSTPADAGATSDLAVPADLAMPQLCNDNQVGDAGIAPTFANVQRVFDNACIGCHCCSDPLSLADGVSYANLVNKTPPMSDRTVNESCGGVLVKPGDPSASYLYQKISTTTPCAGQPMPLSEFSYTPLPTCQQDLIRRWIVAGAPAQ